MTLLTRIREHFAYLKNPSVEELQNRLQALQISKEEIEPYIMEPDQLPYGRNVIYQTPELEVVIINLPGLISSLPHDHGDSLACEVIVEGELTNHIYELKQEGTVRLLCTDVYTEQRICSIERQQIHAIQNSNENRTIILNVYAPPVCKQRTYEVQQPEES
ncbi:cysteine dioxygenase [Brevibacillus ginsengisoli]|uniref:cysteine dioxygenase n=1 Tax=Brevibacillus ginsengisoli TaxID=363854 RepID=UPI003CF58471